MFDHPDDNIAVFDYDELANHLLEQGADASPARLHGCLCGLLAAGSPGQGEAGLALMAQALDINVHGELAGQLLQLYQVSAGAMQDEEFDFHPLLPGDTVAIELRTAALAGWASGFLAGFAQVNQSQVDQESGEILKDFAAIAEAGVDEDADDEEMEGSYLEIIEYLRFAALNVFIQTRADRGDGDLPSRH